MRRTVRVTWLRPPGVGASARPDGSLVVADRNGQRLDGRQEAPVAGLRRELVERIHQSMRIVGPDGAEGNW
jgi:hypothetical protein